MCVFRNALQLFCSISIISPALFHNQHAYSLYVFLNILTARCWISAAFCVLFLNECTICGLTYPQTATLVLFYKHENVVFWRSRTKNVSTDNANNHDFYTCQQKTLLIVLSLLVVFRSRTHNTLSLLSKMTLGMSKMCEHAPPHLPPTKSNFNEGKYFINTLCIFCSWTNHFCVFVRSQIHKAFRLATTKTFV